MIRFQNCRGVRLFRLGSWQVEIWYCPAGEYIPPHRHRRIESHILYLAGRLIFFREGQYLFMQGWRDRLRFLRVAPNQVHSACVTGRFGLFLNVERWTRASITSAAIDFHAA